MQSQFFESEVRHDSPQRLNDIQRELDARRLRLNATPNMATPKAIDQEALDVYLSCFNDDKHRDAVSRFIQNHLKHISMSDMLTSLRSCVNKFNAKNSEPYSVITQEYHSQQWVAELALRYLNQLPKKCVPMSYDFYCYAEQLASAKTLVMFDDCSFTGEQICGQILPGIYERLAETGDNMPRTLFMVIPFITKRACNEILETHQLLQRQYGTNLEFELIHDGFIPSIADLVVPEEDKPLLARAFDASNFKNLEKMVCIFTDWKRPDCVSMPYTLTEPRIPNAVNKYLHCRIDELPEHIQRMKPFIPDVETPYSKDNVVTRRFGY